MPHNVIVDIRLNADYAEEYMAEQFGPRLVETKAFQGCRVLELFQDRDDPLHFMLYEEWERPEDQQAYLAWRTETGIMDHVVENVVTSVTFNHLQRRRDIYEGG